MTRSTILTATLGVLLMTSPVIAQHEHGGVQSGNMHKGMSDMMGRPTIEQKHGGFDIQVWLITQAQHKQMMNGSGAMKGEMKEHMGHGSMANDNEHHMKKDGSQDSAKCTDQEMMTGTHHIIVIVTDQASDSDRRDLEVDVQAVSPTGKKSTVTLSRMMKHYGGGLTLDLPGEYEITMTVRDGEQTVPVNFQYGVELKSR